LEIQVTSLYKLYHFIYSLRLKPGSWTDNRFPTGEAPELNFHDSIFLSPHGKHPQGDGQSEGWFAPPSPKGAGGLLP